MDVSMRLKQGMHIYCVFLQIYYCPGYYIPTILLYLVSTVYPCSINIFGYTENWQLKFSILYFHPSTTVSIAFVLPLSLSWVYQKFYFHHYYSICPNSVTCGMFYDLVTRSKFKYRSFIYFTSGCEIPSAWVTRNTGSAEKKHPKIKFKYLSSQQTDYSQTFTESFTYKWEEVFKILW